MSDHRIHNFSAGPGVLPETVLREAQEALWNLNGSGIGILECSHRSALFEAVIESARNRLRRLLKLSDDQEVLFLHGGARTQFFMLPQNLLRGGRATYLDTGTWAAGAIDEAERFGTIDVPFSSRETGYDHVPAPGSLPAAPDGTLYLHYTSNNTVAGTEFHHVPDVGVPLVCDMSSNILSRPVEGSRYHFIYAGAQKNMGPAGVTLAILKREWLERFDTDLPAMLRYGLHVKKQSMYNTPPTFPIFVVERVTAWLEANGGIEAMEARNIAQANRIYAAIDASDLFRGKTQVESRSRMNITFTTGDAALDLSFAKSASQHGLSGLKGHSSVGGLRASVYNAQTDEAVDALVAFLKEFEANHG
ncbi:MAG: 3-phosphoserine/phosphohydroxythreonine transaminase [Myxococcota bacterium]